VRGAGADDESPDDRAVRRERHASSSWGRGSGRRRSAGGRRPPRYGGCWRGGRVRGPDQAAVP
jgi:hypothetical protein